jgi:predicted nucleotidyltransferase
MIKTKLNAEMLVVVGPMGRDLAAFDDPEECRLWLGARSRDLSRWRVRRPDGQTRGIETFVTAGELESWATAWEGA